MDRNYISLCYTYRVEHWDVNNENVHFDFFENGTGNINITADMFKEIRKFDPKVKLFLNDYNIMEGSDAGVTVLNCIVFN